MDCGCKIAFTDGANAHQRIEGMRIEFCPLHQTASELLQAAKLVSRKATHKQGKAGQEFTDAINKLRDVIAKAQP